LQISEKKSLNFDRIRALTFDCYGTQIDWESGPLGAMRPILAAHGHSLSDAQILEIYSKLEPEEQNPYRRYRDVLANMVRRFGERLSFPISDREAKSLSESLKNWLPFPDTRAALEKLRTKYQFLPTRPIRRQTQMGLAHRSWSASRCGRSAHSAHSRPRRSRMVAHSRLIVPADIAIRFTGPVGAGGKFGPAPVCAAPAAAAPVGAGAGCTVGELVAFGAAPEEFGDPDGGAAALAGLLAGARYLGLNAAGRISAHALTTWSDCFRYLHLSAPLCIFPSMQPDCFRYHKCVIRPLTLRGSQKALHFVMCSL
jgi:hypothetical protein